MADRIIKYALGGALIGLLFGGLIGGIIAAQSGAPFSGVSGLKWFPAGMVFYGMKIAPFAVFIGAAFGVLICAMLKHWRS